MKKSTKLSVYTVLLGGMTVSSFMKAGSMPANSGWFFAWFLLAGLGLWGYTLGVETFLKEVVREKGNKA